MSNQKTMLNCLNLVNAWNWCSPALTLRTQLRFYFYLHIMAYYNTITIGFTYIYELTQTHTYKTNHMPCARVLTYIKLFGSSAYNQMYYITITQNAFISLHYYLFYIFYLCSFALASICALNFHITECLDVYKIAKKSITHTPQLNEWFWRRTAGND